MSLSQASEHLERIAQGGPLDSQLLELTTDNFTLDGSGETLETIARAAKAAVVVLHVAVGVDFTAVFALLDALLDAVPFDTLMELFPLDQIASALQSQVPQVQSLGLKAASRAEPVDIIANTEIVPLCVQLMANNTTTVGVMSHFDSAMKVLMKGELIRRRVLSSEVLTTLRGMSSDCLLAVRRYDFVLLLLPYVGAFGLPEELYQLTEWHNDEVWVLATLQFYEKVVAMDKDWLIEGVVPSLYFILQSYDKGEMLFTQSFFDALFAKVSLVAPVLFKDMDEQFIKITVTDTMLLALVNPDYFTRSRPDIIKSLPPLSESTTGIYCNFMRTNISFECIKDRLKSTSLTSMSYLEFINFVEFMVHSEHSTKYLLSELPSVMNRLLHPKTHIIETDTFQLRVACLERLLQYGDVLGVWKQGVRLEYEKATKGRKIMPGVEIMDTTM